jgi:hypothetical protein
MPNIGGLSKVVPSKGPGMGSIQMLGKTPEIKSPRERAFGQGPGVGSLQYSSTCLKLEAHVQYPARDKEWAVMFGKAGR